MKTAMMAGMVLALGLCLLSACATTQPRFSHTRHRGDYTITLEELKTLRFYISTDVIARTASNSPDQPAGTETFLISEGTPGVALDAGPDWVRVAFGDGPGVVFLADRFDQSYYLASEQEGEAGLRPIQQIPDRILLRDGVRYQVVRGYHALLLVNEIDLERIRDSRAKVKGRLPATATRS